MNERCKAVKRIAGRFPEEFMFVLTREELAEWRSQFVSSRADRMGLRHARPSASSWPRQSPGCARSGCGSKRPGRRIGCGGRAAPPGDWRIEHALLRSTMPRRHASPGELKSDSWEFKGFRAKRVSGTYFLFRYLFFRFHPGTPRPAGNTAEVRRAEGSSFHTRAESRATWGVAGEGRERPQGCARS
jgi:hypothetical protein